MKTLVTHVTFELVKEQYVKQSCQKVTKFPHG
jgi:hypothetical protein